MVDIGNRQTGRECGANVFDSIEWQFEWMSHMKYEPEYLFGNGTAGQQIADILATIDLPKIQKRITY